MDDLGYIVEVSFEDLPKEARDLISDDQISYIDEFMFLQRTDGRVAAHYAGEIIAVWDGAGWKPGHVLSHVPVKCDGCGSLKGMLPEETHCPTCKHAAT